MEESKTDTTVNMDLIQSWITMMSQLFPGNAGGAERKTEGDARGPGEGHGRVSQEALLSLFKTWGTLSSAMSEPSAAGTIASGMASLPDIMARFFQTGLTGFLNAQAQFTEKIQSMGKHTEAYRFENLDQNGIKAWSEFYDKELRQYLKIPQLGLVRFYQERFNHAVDRFNIMNAKLGDFLQILMLPMEKSFKVLHEKIEEQVRGRKLPEDPHEHYRLWVKILEGHYMTLFKSPEYTKALAETLSAFEEFISARNRLFTDLMQSLPIPTSKDLDDLYGELYHLKKRVRDLEKANSELRNTAASGG
ncbi:MAG TPA: poly(R)-hydroxyalkanoic acid synthase subunit PhaE [Deltaproteobacteria bacterium]|nr:poly(R)-hydroxyalkanoic acid synthase subunit PhaE [Deltaproteobacteria bacterium]